LTGAGDSHTARPYQTGKRRKVENLAALVARRTVRYAYQVRLWLEGKRLSISSMSLCDWKAAWYWLARRRPLRRAAGLLLRGISRRLMVRLDRGEAPRAQTRLLLGLVHRSRQTPFGLSHDFARMRTPEDYRRLVPLSTATAPLPSAPDIAYRAAWRLALAEALHRGFPMPLLADAFVMLGDPDDCAARLPFLIAPFGCGGEGPALATGTVCLAGSLRHLLSWTETRTELPNLALVLYKRDPELSPAALCAQLNTRAAFVEMATLLDVPVAVEDTRHDKLRLLADDGVYYEFIPRARVHHQRPERLPLDQVKAGESYELVLTTAAGLWACRTGQMICFDRLSPPLLTLTGPVPAAPEALTPVAVLEPSTPPAGRPRSDGIPAVPTGTFGHTPWSARADQG
jgi:GH3 auxin-responsive promoter